MRRRIGLAFILILLFSVVAYAQDANQPIQKKIGLGIKAGGGAILGDELSKTGQAMGPVTSVELHFNLQETVEVLTEFSYAYNDVDFTNAKFQLGEADVNRIYQRAITMGFRFYMPQLRMGSFLPTLSFGGGYYEWYYTNSSDLLNLNGNGIQTYKGERLSFHSLGINAGLGLRIKLKDNFALDGISRFHFIQSKDNRGRFGPDDDNDMSIDFGLGLVYLFPFGS